jgi:hypothetical protein
VPASLRLRVKSLIYQQGAGHLRTNDLVTQAFQPVPMLALATEKANFLVRIRTLPPSMTTENSKPKTANCLTIIGGGLAGAEAAWQAALRGVAVRLYEMKPRKFSPAHHSPLLGELVCSNSLRADSQDSAVACSKRRCAGWVP